jgi:hypothetical protein
MTPAGACQYFTSRTLDQPNVDSSMLACSGVVGMGLVAYGSDAVLWHGKGDPGKFPIKGTPPPAPYHSP